MTPANEPPIVRVRQFVVDAWAKYLALWKAGRGGIAVALLLPCCLCSLCGSIVMVSGDDAPDPTATPRVEATARPTRTTGPSPSVTHVVTREPTATDEPPTKVPTAVQPTSAPTAVPVLPTEAPPTAEPAPQIQPLIPQQPAAPPAEPPPPRPDLDANGDLDCKHFASRREAQSWWDYWHARGVPNPGRLDGNDNDNRVCESY